ncbi:MAG: hypothetical protein ACNA7E_05695, partial [Wenzhouxiangellaceae bacterium]
MTRISPRAFVCCSLAFMLVSAGALARGPVSEDMWIVYLEDAPTAAFAGSALESVTVGGQAVRKQYAPTAPSVTGAARLRVNSPEVVSYAGYLDRRREAVLGAAGATLG